MYENGYKLINYINMYVQLFEKKQDAKSTQMQVFCRPLDQVSIGIIQEVKIKNSQYPF